MNDQPPPMPFPPPWAWQPRPYHGNEVPARVTLALEFLAQLTFKTMTRGMVSGVGMAEIDGQELLPVEHEAQAAACNMLTAYFEGRLEPTAWEVNVTRAHLPGAAQITGCPRCGGTGKLDDRKCPACNGKTIIITQSSQ